MLILREFTLEDKNLVLDMIEEINKTDQNFEGLGIFRDITSYENLLNQLNINKIQGTDTSPKLHQTTYGLFDNNELIGGINLRHELKGNTINHGGHIGYLIKPTKRNKGYGTKLLHLALIKAKELNINNILITCNKNNKASEKVILNNNGKYENDYYDPFDHETYKRYWIQN